MEKTDSGRVETAEKRNVTRKDVCDCESEMDATRSKMPEDEERKEESRCRCSD